eukprot:TRINITY_DN20390_c0_g1_i1.p2 TRINITY_DN20390_c0_g1~~TRINITY_DN20390_c0_g1_i1.p2  ORF type:complete len:294 (+),score=83.61 TRINITY_DN20390_c0_g1_i1:77-958(+)
MPRAAAAATVFAALAGTAQACDSTPCGGPCSDGKQLGTCMDVGGKCDCVRFPARPLLRGAAAPRPQEASAAVRPPPKGGLYCGGIPGILTMNLTIIDGAHLSLNSVIAAADIVVACSSESFEYQHDTGVLDISKAMKDPSDCLAKASLQDGGSRFTFTFDGDSTVTAKNSKWGSVDLKVTGAGSCRPEALHRAAPATAGHIVLQNCADSACKTGCTTRTVNFGECFRLSQNMVMRRVTGCSGFFINVQEYDFGDNSCSHLVAAGQDPIGTCSDDTPSWEYTDCKVGRWANGTA